MTESQKVRINESEEKLKEMLKRDNEDLSNYSDPWICGYAEGNKNVSEYILKQIDYLRKAER